MKKLYVLGVTVVTIWLMIQFPHAMLNPGHLSAGHSELNKKCLSCHKPFRGIPDDKCISCHKVAEIGKDAADPAKRLFHKELSTVRCTSCHTDHKGMNPEKQFNGFNHSLLSSAVVNNCNSCHQQPADTLHALVSASCSHCHTTTGWKTGASFDHALIQGIRKNDCASCHQKPGDAYHRTITDNCDKCHSTAKWIPSTFDHSAYFRLDKDHTTTCNTCHTSNNLSIYTCYGCHEHTESKMLQEHNEEGIYNITDCASCHKSGNKHDIRGNGKENEIKDYLQKQKNEKDPKEKDDD
jgi:hypothetical protein